MKKEKKHPVSYAATASEMVMLERIKTFHKRKSNTDAIRFLVESENEKILRKNVPISTRP